MTTKITLMAVMAALTLFTEVPAAASISYKVVNLSGNTWQYQYTPTDLSFTNLQGFTVFFDQNEYGPLSNPVANSDWDLMTADPDLTLASSGFFDALATVMNPSMASFTVDFVYHGAGTPGPQPWEVYSLDPLQVLNSGETVPISGVPEPRTSVLAALGCALLALGLRRRRLN
jgi:hypothetical protein